MTQEEHVDRMTYLYNIRAELPELVAKQIKEMLLALSHQMRDAAK